MSRYVFIRWAALSGKYTFDETVSNGLYTKLQSNYNEPARHYHTLKHVESMLHLSEQYAAKLKDKDLVDFAVFYHDIVYQPGLQDNEQQSVQIAEGDLRTLGANQEMIDSVKLFIETTGSHQPQENAPKDLLYFLDFDLSILGADAKMYLSYSRGIRQEFNFVNEAAYAFGRDAFLTSLLQKPYLFFTDDFRERYEQIARENIKKEIEEYRQYYSG